MITQNTQPNPLEDDESPNLIMFEDDLTFTT